MRFPLRPRSQITLGLLLTSVIGIAMLPFFHRKDPPQAALSPTLREASVASRDSDLPRVLSSDDSDEARAAIAAILHQRLNQSGIRADEAVLIFKDAEAYRRFSTQAGAARLLGRIDRLLAIHVRVIDYPAFVRDLAANPNVFASITANPILSSPQPPKEDRAAAGTAMVGTELLAQLGLPAGSAGAADLGQGVMIAVLDGGVLPDPTFGSRLRYLDIGYGLNGLGGDAQHGTAVASIAAGAAADAPGVAPAATVLSIRVTGADGLSDTFAAAQGIYAAVDAGARIINLSLGGYATTGFMGEAVEYALAAGVAVVASSGNDQAAQLVWPAAYAGVVSVGAVDAHGVQTLFSNSGLGLQLTAPGYAVQAAGIAGERILFSGTSASAPVVAGAIASLLSQDRRLTPLQAADRLATFSNDGGIAGEDPDYGRGTLNLGWALHADDTSRTDPAISSQSFDAKTGQLAIVVQNRGAQPLSGVGLVVSSTAGLANKALPSLAPGASTTVVVKLDPTSLSRAEGLQVISQLLLPPELIDQDPTNNQRRAILRLRPQHSL